LKKIKMTETRIFGNKQLLTEHAAKIFADLCDESIKSHGNFSVALSGGNTPLELFKLLATESYSKSIDWKKIFIFWGDERMVESNHKDNNSFQARSALLDHVNIPPENIFPVQVQYSAEKAAEHYSKTIRSIFRNDWPSFDLVLLGLGDDAHTASLFPHSEVLKEWDQPVSEADGKSYKRISFTARLINQAKNIIFLVSGN